MSDNSEKKILGFVDSGKDPSHYVKRFLNESKYKSWFERNYPNYTIYEAIGISESEYQKIVNDLLLKSEPTVEEASTETVEPTVEEASTETVEPTVEEASTETVSEIDPLERLKEAVEKLKAQEQIQETPEQKIEEEGPKIDTAVQTILESEDEGPEYGPGHDYSFEDFVDERALVSHDVFGKKQMKIKVLEVSDENQPSQIRWKFGNRVKVNKILITIKHLDTQEIEEGEFDIEAIEKELAEKRHWSSSNRWVHANDIKNGYIVNSRHTVLISDAAALDYITF